MDNIKRELVIHCSDEIINIALLEEGQLVELHKEQKSVGYGVGDIYLGKVRKTMSGLNAAFVSIGSARDAFIHYLDLGVQFRSFNKMIETVTKRKPFSMDNFKKQEEVVRGGKINDVLSAGQTVMVQVIKEAISTKGPRVSTEISLTGRHIVLLPFAGKVSVSQKIRSNEERKRLRGIVSDLLPHGSGAIIRTAAGKKERDDIEADVRQLLAKWET